MLRLKWRDVYENNFRGQRLEARGQGVLFIYKLDTILPHESQRAIKHLHLKILQYLIQI
jgi:hypothetical protein